MRPMRLIKSSRKVAKLGQGEKSVFEAVDYIGLFVPV